MNGRIRSNRFSPMPLMFCRSSGRVNGECERYCKIRSAVASPTPGMDMSLVFDAVFRLTTVDWRSGVETVRGRAVVGPVCVARSWVTFSNA